MSEVSTRFYDLTVAGRPIVPLGHADAVKESDEQETLISRRWKVLRDVLQPRREARGVPFEFTMEVTSRCNLSCPMCPREITPEPGERDMDMDTFRQVLDRIRDVASFVWLAGLGEPMMNKHFVQMIEQCRQAGIVTGASTNGTFLTRKWQQRLLDSGLDLLIVSFDGVDKQSYEKVRVGADFDKVKENVCRLAALKVARGAKKPWLILQMIELSQTAGQAGDFRRMWNIPGVDAVRIKKDELQFDEALAVEGQRKRTGKRPCPFLWRGTPLIQWDGTMQPCCYGVAEKSFGNLKNASVEQLWNSLRVRQLRRSHLEGHGLSEPFCEHCNAFQPGKAPMTASVLVPSLLQKKYAGVVEAANRRVQFME